MEQFTCTACNNFHVGSMDIMVLHQSECAGLSPKKREFRVTMARLKFGANYEKAMEILHREYPPTVW